MMPIADQLPTIMHAAVRSAKNHKYDISTINHSFSEKTMFSIWQLTISVSLFVASQQRPDLTMLLIIWRGLGGTCDGFGSGR